VLDTKSPKYLEMAQGHISLSGWRSLVIARLQGFLSCSLAAVPHQWSPRMMTVSLVVEKRRASRAVASPLPSALRMFIIRAGGRASRVGVLPSAWAGDPLLPPAFGGEGRSPALRRRRTATCCLVRVWLSVHCTGDSHAVRRSATSTARPAPPATPGGSYKTSYAAGAVSAFLEGPVFTPVARTGVRTSFCALRRLPFAGAALVRRWPLSSVLRWWPP
jgi:hypothetical protein